MSDFPSSALSDFVLPDSDAVTNHDIDSDKLVGLRFSYFIKQQYDRAVAAGKKHGFYEEMAAAIGCSGSLLHKWKDPEKVLIGLKERESVSANVLRGVREAFRISSEAFFVNAKDLPNHVVLADGSTRPTLPGEVDFYAPVFDLSRKRDQLDTATRKQVSDHDERILVLEAENIELKSQNAKILKLLERLVGTTATNR
jgi:hypothetical protein